MEPEEITVIILSAKGLHAKKKGRGKYSVIFGVGNNKYRTDVVKESTGNPTWNQESIITISDTSKPLKIVVTDREDVLGQVVVPLQCLQTTKMKPEEAPLRTHRKCSNPQGEIGFQAWITKHHMSDIGDDNVCLIPGNFAQESTSQSTGSLPRKNSAISKLKDKLLHGSSSNVSGDSGKLSSKGKRGSLSVLNLSLGRRSSKSKSKDADSGRMYRANSTFAFGTGSKFSLSSSNKALSCIDLNQPVGVPKITSATPDEVLVEGGAQVTIEGEFLGHSREDVIGLFLASSNCLDTLQYESSKKLHCWTKAWKPCSGPVVVVTQSGGRGVSKTQFAFISANDFECQSIQDEIFESNNNLNLSLSSEETGYVSDSSKKDKDITKDEKRLSLLSVPSHEGQPEKAEKTHKRKDSLHNILQALTTKDKSSSLTKADMMSEIEKLKLENQKVNSDNQALKVKNKNLLTQNKELHEQNKNLKVYIDKLLSRVIMECPDVLKS